MKKIVVSLILMLACGASFADNVRFINGDGSEITELCIAAASSASNLNEMAVKLGIQSFTKDDVLCNGMPLNKFMRKYREIRTPDTVIMSFRKLDDSPETRLCYAAVTFSPDIERIKAD